MSDWTEPIDDPQQKRRVIYLTCYEKNPNVEIEVMDFDGEGTGHPASAHDHDPMPLHNVLVVAQAAANAYMNLDDNRMWVALRNCSCDDEDGFSHGPAVLAICVNRENARQALIDDLMAHGGNIHGDEWRSPLVPEDYDGTDSIVCTECPDVWAIDRKAIG